MALPFTAVLDSGILMTAQEITPLGVDWTSTPALSSSQSCTTDESVPHLKCMTCQIDRRRCVFTNPTTCDWCAQNHYHCSSTEIDSSPKRRKLSKHKCDECRRSKQKCLPEERIWPQKCNLCTQKSLPCSEPRPVAVQGEELGRTNVVRVVNEQPEEHDTIASFPANDYFNEILQWLSAPDPSTNHKKALERHQANTGLWFLKGQQYEHWKTDSASMLWLKGIPGCGKTILSSLVIQDIQQDFNHGCSTSSAYFYFDFKDAQKQIPESMIRSLISQFLQTSVRVPTSLVTLFSFYENRRQQPLQAELLQVLHDTILGFGPTYIVIDALDECNDRYQVLDMLEKIAGWQMEGLHILFTSRNEQEIDRSLGNLIDGHHIIHLEGEMMDKDIQNYIHERLSKDKNLRKWEKDPNIRREIEVALMQGAQGMFRWAACQLDMLRKCRNRLMVRKSLQGLPQTLDETYERILCSISEEDVTYAIRALQWLAFASRPLQVEEMAEAIAIDLERERAFDSQEIFEDPFEVLNICSCLVTIFTIEEVLFSDRDFDLQMSGKVVAFAHHSMRDYLLSDRSRQGPAAKFSVHDATCNEFIAKSCLGYLLQFEAQESLSHDSLKDFKLAKYSAKFWIIHAEAAAQETDDLLRMILKLFRSESDAYFNWIRIHDPDQPRHGTNIGREFKTIPVPLYYASLYGLIGTVTALLDNGADVNARGGHYSTALQAACYKGHHKIIELLVDKGADLNAQGGWYGNPLQAAVVGGHERLVKLLLERGAHVCAQGGYYRNALQAASIGNHEKVVEKVVELLVVKWSGVNVQGQPYNYILQAASGEVRDPYLETLFGQGAHPKAEDSHHLNALQTAAESLLAKGADIVAQGGSSLGNALQPASSRGFGNIIELLLFKCFCVDVRSGTYDSALTSASYRADARSVEMLLGNRGKVNAPDGGRHTPEHATPGVGYNKIVKLLSDYSADVNTYGGHYDSTLQAASERGYQRIVQLLLYKGADVGAQSGKHHNALPPALLAGQKTVVELLLTMGANVNA